MAAIAFTDRELQKAWKNNLQASMSSTCSNAHRLLLFYAIECGLKAVLMKRRSITCTDLCSEIGEAQHNINKLLDYLSAGNALKLPTQLQMSPIKPQGRKVERKLDVGQINQVWRYGGCFISSKSRRSSSSTSEDEAIENKLMQISNWISGELNS
jgi:hypothetical protein